MSKSLAIVAGLIAGASIIIMSCNRHSTSEQIRNAMKGIDWRLDESMEVHFHGSGSSGGGGARRSTYSLAADLVAPEGFILPKDSSDQFIAKISTAIEQAGGDVIEARCDNGINYTEYSKNFDQSAYIYKVVYKADGTVGYISGTLIKRRYSNEPDKGRETVGQILLSLHEVR